jgi:acetyl-CoA carboxylase biotin carboxylase subunit
VKKLLIANRGEIALRINRAAHELGIATVAIFSEADRAALHVSAADEAYCVGPGQAARSYLNIPNILSAAQISGADAIHPGYGFLAENARFAEICGDHGLKFVGPSPAVIAQMGDKAVAKQVMKRAGIATTPGTEALPSIEAAREAARKIGYPVLLKAAAGGGGKGMRAVADERDLERAYVTAQAEAEANFKDGRLYLERLLEHPRHIEVQVVGDDAGTVVHVGERDCSVQKPSHQKLIEEAPATNLSDRLRKRLHGMAVDAARAVRYTSAGTLEFLVAGDDIYFMEMNTRIQVEHPVTEMIYNIDLVEEQLRIADGKPHSYKQRDLVAHGHAIECRINAEDAHFAPAAGTLQEVYLPGGFGVRVDSHIYGGLTISPHYDSLLAKVVAHGATREQAIVRMDCALREARVTGIPTTIPMCRMILADPGFRAGAVPVDYLPALLAQTAAV